MKRVLKGIGYSLLGLLLLIGSGISYLYFISSGATAHIQDTQGNPVPNSIASLEQIELNGTKQWILIRGYDRTKPILLFLHGGPGYPQMPSLTNNEAMEKRFVVVHWDQRGSGKSYDPSVFTSSFTLKTFIEDAAQLSRLLIHRFPRPGADTTKIYLMGHSWGSFLGLQTVKKYPQLFYAYLGMGQVANPLMGEQVTYDWCLQQARQHHNTEQVTLLAQVGRPPFRSMDQWMSYLGPQRQMVIDYGGAIHTGSYQRIYIANLFLCREYTLSDKLNYLTGGAETVKRLWPTIVNTDLTQSVPRVAIPVYLFQGIHDHQTPYQLAKAYFDRLEAPKKLFFTFNRSAHGPIYEEPNLFWSRVDTVLSQGMK